MGLSHAVINFEEKGWSAANKLRTNMDAAEQKHVVLGLLFLKYILDTFQGKLEELTESDQDFVKYRNAYTAAMEIQAILRENIKKSMGDTT